MSGESPEQLVDAFRAAALSVTKLYKTSAAAQAKSRADGYQDCLDDLLAFLDRANMGLDDGEGWKVRRWATERLGGRYAASAASAALESEDEADKAETMSSPEMQTTSTATTGAAAAQAVPSRMDSAPPPSSSAATAAANPPRSVTPQEPDLAVPTQDAFTFQSTHPYPQPQESYLNLASLDLSDSRAGDGTLAAAAAAAVAAAAASPHSRSSRARLAGSGNLRTASRTPNHVVRAAGQKRKLNIAEIFDLGSLGYTKDMLGGGAKRSRHA